MWIFGAALLMTPSASADEGILPKVDIEFQVMGNVETSELSFAPNVIAEVRTNRDTYVYLDGRVATQGDWTGRMGAGVDLLGASKADLTIGGFAGSTGNVFNEEFALSPQGGVELGVGYELSRFRAKYRWRGGLRSQASSAYLMESEVDVGVRLIQQLLLVDLLKSVYLSECIIFLHHFQHL